MDAPKDYRYDYHIVWDDSYGSTPVFSCKGYYRFCYSKSDCNNEVNR